MSNAWFRFYSETLQDRKLERIARATGNDKVTLLGIWITLLSLANDSPERGVLLLVDNIPLTFEDFCYETEQDKKVLKPIIDKFIKFDMLSCDDKIYYIKNWGKRQFKSDSCKERVDRYRERKAKEKQQPSNVSETLQQQPSNAPESDTESDTEQNQKEHGAKSAPSLSHFQELKAYWVELFPDKPKPRTTNSSAPGKVATRMKSPHFVKNWRAAMLRASKSNYIGLKETTWFDFLWFVKTPDNYEACLNGKYDFKPGSKRTEPPQTAKVVIPEKTPEQMFGGGR